MKPYRIDSGNGLQADLGFHKVRASTKYCGHEVNVNVDVCHLLPQPPAKKGDKFILLCNKEERTEYERVY